MWNQSVWVFFLNQRVTSISCVSQTTDNRQHSSEWCVSEGVGGGQLPCQYQYCQNHGNTTATPLKPSCICQRPWPLFTENLVFVYIGGWYRPEVNNSVNNQIDRWWYNLTQDLVCNMCWMYLPKTLFTQETERKRNLRRKLCPSLRLATLLLPISTLHFLFNAHIFCVSTHFCSCKIAKLFANCNTYRPTYR